MPAINAQRTWIMRFCIHHMHKHLHISTFKCILTHLKVRRLPFCMSVCLSDTCWVRNGNIDVHYARPPLMHEILSMPQSGSFIPFFPRSLGWNPTRFKSYFDSHDFSYCICFFCWAGGFKSLMVFACWMHPLIISKKRGGIILWKPILEPKWILSALIGPLHTATTAVITIEPPHPTSPGS